MPRDLTREFAGLFGRFGEFDAASLTTPAGVHLRFNHAPAGVVKFFELLRGRNGLFRGMRQNTFLDFYTVRFE